MPECGARKPDNYDLTCDRPQPSSQHRFHTGYLPGEGFVDWPNEAYVPPPPRPGSHHDSLVGYRSLLNEAEAARRLARAVPQGEAQNAAQIYVRARRGGTLRRTADYLLARRDVWIDAIVFTSPEIGSKEGSRRVRELKEAGWPIQTRHESGTNWQHMLPSSFDPWA